MHARLTAPSHLCVSVGFVFGFNLLQTVVIRLPSMCAQPAVFFVYMHFLYVSTGNPNQYICF